LEVLRIRALCSECFKLLFKLLTSSISGHAMNVSATRHDRRSRVTCRERRAASAVQLLAAGKEPPSIGRQQAMDQQALMRMSSATSCFACSVAIVVYSSSVALKKKLHNQIIFNIAVSEFFSAVGGLLGTSKSGSFQCGLQTFLTNYFPLTSIFWTTVIAYFLFCLLDLPHADQRQKKIMSLTWVHVLCWGLPLVVTLGPLTTDHFGTFDGNDGWCFLRPGNQYPNWTYVFWIFVAFFAWVYLAIFFYIFLTIYVFLKVLRADYPEPRLKEIAIKSLRRLVSYPIIILLSWCSMTVYILWSTFDPSAHQLEQPTFVKITSTVPLFSGTLTSLAFFSFSSEARHTLIRLLCCISLSSEDNSANDFRKRMDRLLMAIKNDEEFNLDSETPAPAPNTITCNLWFFTKHFQNRVAPLPTNEGREHFTP
jgi:hypothetical protein